MAQSERLHWIDGRLQGGGHVHWKDIAEKFAVHRRAIFGDIKFLRERLGAPIAFSRRLQGWHYTEPHYKLPFLALTDSEADTLRRTCKPRSPICPMRMPPLPGIWRSGCRLKCAGFPFTPAGLAAYRRDPRCFRAGCRRSRGI